MSSIGDKDWVLNGPDCVDQTTAPAGAVGVEVSNASNSEHSVDLYINSAQIAHIGKGAKTECEDCAPGDEISIRNFDFSSGDSSGQIRFHIGI